MVKLIQSELDQHARDVLNRQLADIAAENLELNAKHVSSQQRIAEIYERLLKVEERREWKEFFSLIFSALSLFVAGGSLVVAGFAFWFSIKQ